MPSGLLETPGVPAVTRCSSCDQGAMDNYSTCNLSIHVINNITYNGFKLCVASSINVLTLIILVVDI